MKNLALLTVAIFISSAAVSASQKELFTCEKIKDKITRNQCIDAREDGKKEELAKFSMQSKADETAKAEKALAAEKRKTSDELVSKAKALLAQNLKDPDSAKFSNIVIATGPGRTLVCGSINAKNSYGGYVGAKKFFVLWSVPLANTPEVYTDGDEIARAKARMDELKSLYASAPLSSQVEAAREGDRIINSTKLESMRNQKVLREQCIANDDTVITQVDG